MRYLQGLPVARITIVRIVCQILLLLENFIQSPYNSIEIYEEEFIFCLIAELTAVNYFQVHSELRKSGWFKNLSWIWFMMQFIL